MANAAAQANETASSARQIVLLAIPTTLIDHFAETREDMEID
jgi:hypothetical protein